MLTSDDIHFIREQATAYWTKEICTLEFVAIAAGKEIGHKIGDLVDEKTTALLKSSGRFTIRHQHKNGEAASRSMGDLWIEAGGIYNPVNIKAGEYGKNGQPNLVSLKRVLSALSESLIDSYYLLIMKIKHNGTQFVPYVYMVDMLDFLEYTVYNSGPGQMMLKEAQFYPAIEAMYASGNVVPTSTKTLREKIDRLFEMLENADKQLYFDREKKRMQVKEQVAKYIATPSPSIVRARQEEYFSLG